VGSGKTGMTNVLRVAGKKAAALVLMDGRTQGADSRYLRRFPIPDGLLLVGGSAMCWLGYSAEAVAGLAAIAAMCGLYSCKFKAGGASPLSSGRPGGNLSTRRDFLAAKSFFLGAGLTNTCRSSIAGVIGSYVILAPLTATDGFPLKPSLRITGVMLVIYMHRDNIWRLAAGKERKLGEKVETREKSLPDAFRLGTPP